jgi:hypothetical protein
MAEFRFTVPAGHKPGNCVGENVQFTMGGALVITADGPGNNGGRNMDYLLATNKKILAALPISVEGDRPKHVVLLPGESVNANGKPAQVVVNGEVRTTTGKKISVAPLPDQAGRYPAVGQVFPRVCQDAIVLTLDAQQLADLAAAISPTGVVTMFIPRIPLAKDNAPELLPVCHPVPVVGADDEGRETGIGLFMPLSAELSGQHVNSRIVPRLDYLREHVRKLPQNPVKIGPTKV